MYRINLLYWITFYNHRFVFYLFIYYFFSETGSSITVFLGVFFFCFLLGVAIFHPCPLRHLASLRHCCHARLACVQTLVYPVIKRYKRLHIGSKKLVLVRWIFHRKWEPNMIGWLLIYSIWFAVEIFSTSYCGFGKGSGVEVDVSWKWITVEERVVLSSSQLLWWPDEVDGTSPSSTNNNERFAVTFVLTASPFAPAFSRYWRKRLWFRIRSSSFFLWFLLCFRRLKLTRQICCEVGWTTKWRSLISLFTKHAPLFITKFRSEAFINTEMLTHSWDATNNYS